MIHEIGVELGARLAAQGCPIRVIDGPEATTTTTYSRERIVLEHDENGGDTFGPALSQHKNPKSRMTRKQGMKITIYAQHPASGPLEFEHRRRADHILDLVLVGLDDVARARHNSFTPTTGSFVQPDDLAKSAAPAGAVYELKFTFDRAVNVQTWVGAARTETTLAVIDSHTNVTGKASAASPEIAESA